MSIDGETASQSGNPLTQGRAVLSAFWDENSSSFELPAEGIATLGRGEGCEFRVDHPSVSRMHARFFLGALTQVEDLGSRNGTRIHGVPLARGYRIPISPGDILECGDVMLLLREVRASSTSPLGMKGMNLDAASANGGELVLGANALWFEFGAGGRVRLARHGALRRILLKLAEERLSRPGASVSVEEVIRAGWPDEIVLYEAALQRTYTTIRRLRALGLERVLLTREAGYVLDARCSVRFEDG